jgi:TRAP-type uncharacterized transport system substrate-binding protein
MADTLPFRSASTTEPLPFRPPNAPDIRTFAIAQMAVALAADRSSPERPFREIRVGVGSARDGSFTPRLTLASDTPNPAEAVLKGEIDLGVFNPSAYLTMACRGLGPFAQPLPLRAIGVMPSLDWQVFAVSERFGLPSVAAIGEKKIPLRISVRADAKNSTRFVVDEVLGAYGFSLADVERWGGSLQLIDSPRDPARIQGMRDGTVDAVFDEGISGWGHLALECGMRFLPLGEAGGLRLKELGWRLLPISRDEFPELTEESVGVSFSGWPLFTRADLPDELAYQMAKALDATRPLVEWDSTSRVELRDLCVSSDACPLDVPLHPGAARYYQEQGAL